LAGDALLTIAFEILADPRTHEDPKVRCALVAALAKASGANGMIGGQMLDLIAETTTLDIGAITRLQRMKTGELIACATEMGGILGKASPALLNALRAYAHDLGLAFQIIDDLLDAEGTEEETGKPVGRDEKAGKATFVTILGQERARNQARLLSEQAIQHLSLFDGRASLLEDVARFVVDRKA
jgi:farnesyl diphosphate synthase